MTNEQGISATREDFETLQTELKSQINGLGSEVGGLRSEVGRLRSDLNGLRGEVGQLELRIDTKIETAIDSAVKQILAAFDIKMDQVRSDMAFADDHETLKTRSSGPVRRFV